MVFHINDPKGIRIPYHPEWRKRIRGAPARAVESPMDHPRFVRQHQEPWDLQSSISRADEEGLVQQDKSRPQDLPPLIRTKITVGKVMSQPVSTLEPDDRLWDVWTLICKTRYRFLPVVTRGEKVIGIVSDRGLLKVIQQYLEKGVQLNEVLVEDFMGTHVITAHPTAEVDAVLKLFFEEHVGCIPIVGDDEKILGILTRTDILRLGRDFLSLPLDDR